MKLKKYLVTLALVGSILSGSALVLAEADSSRHRLTVDRPLQVAGQELAPGRYEVRLENNDGQRARLIVAQKGETVVSTSAVLHALDQPVKEDGLKAILPDGKTRVLEQLWFRGARYRIQIEAAGEALAAARAKTP